MCLFFMLLHLEKTDIYNQIVITVSFNEAPQVLYITRLLLKKEEERLLWHSVLLHQWTLALNQTCKAKQTLALQTRRIGKYCWASYPQKHGMIIIMKEKQKKEEEKKGRNKQGRISRKRGRRTKKINDKKKNKEGRRRRERKKKMIKN